MKTSVIGCAILLALLSVGSASAETEDECRNNMDVQKFIDGKCNVLKGFDAVPGSLSKNRLQHDLILGPLPNFRKSPRKLDPKGKVQQVEPFDQPLEETKPEVQNNQHTETKENSNTSIEKTTPVVPDESKP